MADDLRERVALERTLHYRSDRAAADAGGVSNTTWSRFMAGGDVTDGIRQAVAKAFGWSTDWPENPPPSPITNNGGPTNADLLVAISQMADRVARTLEGYEDQMSDIERKLDDLLARPNGRAGRSRPSA